MKTQALEVGAVAGVLLFILSIGITFIVNIVKYDIVW